MKVPGFLALDASKRTIRVLLGGRSIPDHVNCELAVVVQKNGNTIDRFASGPLPKFAQTPAGQILTTDPDRKSLKPHITAQHRHPLAIFILFLAAKRYSAINNGQFF
jgi:hypothetical protein